MFDFKPKECMGPVAIISAGLQIAGGMAQQSAISSETAAQTAQMQAQINASRYNRDVALQNAKITQGQTQAALDKGDREMRLRQGAAFAAGGASGVGLSSFEDILFSSAQQEELDLLTIQSEGSLKERGFTNTAALEGQQMSSLNSQIPLIKSAGKARGAAAMLSGMSKGISGMSMPTGETWSGGEKFRTF